MASRFANVQSVLFEKKTQSRNSILYRAWRQLPVLRRMDLILAQLLCP
jgi:hypothetical protein